MKAGSKIAAHRGGNNARLRLHLGITIPDGDCKMRVHDTVIGWNEGRCLVFDDYFEHEVWNLTSEDRLVLVVDLWHSDLTENERTCLNALNLQVTKQAMGRHNYWLKNRAQKEQEQKGATKLIEK